MGKREVFCSITSQWSRMLTSPPPPNPSPHLSEKASSSPVHAGTSVKMGCSCKHAAGKRRRFLIKTHALAFCVLTRAWAALLQSRTRYKPEEGWELRRPQNLETTRHLPTVSDR